MFPVYLHMQLRARVSHHSQGHQLLFSFLTPGCDCKGAGLDRGTTYPAAPSGYRTRSGPPRRHRHVARAGTRAQRQASICALNTEMPFSPLFLPVRMQRRERRHRCPKQHLGPRSGFALCGRGSWSLSELCRPALQELAIGAPRFLQTALPWSMPRFPGVGRALQGTLTHVTHLKKVTVAWPAWLSG